MRNFRAASLFAILSTLILTSLSFAAPPDRIAGPLGASRTFKLSGGIPLQAAKKFDQGPVDPSLQLGYITLLTTPSAAQKKALTKLLADQQNRHSASFHKWLTPEQYADQFGLSLNDIGKLTAWLKSQGFTIVRTSRGRNFIVFSGTAAQVESAFQLQIHNFKVDNEIHFANTTAPSIPASLSGIVVGFHGLNNFRPKSQARRAVAPAYTFAANGGDYLFLAPGDIGTIYDINTLYQNGFDGSGQTLAVMGQTGIYQSDLTNFRQNFGLSAISCTTSSDIITGCNSSNFKYVLVNGSATTIYSDLPEADIDIEWSGATAKNAKVIFVNATSSSGGGVWDSWYYAVDNNVAPVITMSYTAPCEGYEAGGTGEGSIEGDEAELAMANSEGITFMNSAGDTGAAECDNFNITDTNTAIAGYAVAYPASSQYVTGVGGTLIPFTENTSTYWGNSNGTSGGSALSYIPEQAWNDSLEFAYFCEANPTNGFCSENGVGGGPVNTDWATMQQQIIGISAGGGGVSNCVTVDNNGVCTGGFPQPSWQSGISMSTVNPSGFGLVSSGTPTRMSPDVSLLASANWPGYLVCTQYSAIGGSAAGSSCDSASTGISDMLNACLVSGTEPCSIYGGTSVSSPVFAGIVTIMNQYLVSNGAQSEPGLGNINPMLYTLAAAPGNGAFNQVTTPSSGAYSNGAWCEAGTPSSGIGSDPWPTALVCPNAPNDILSFNTYNSDPTTGYNLATGLGSVDANNFATAWLDVVAGNFTLTNTGSSTETVLAGQSTSNAYSFTVTPTLGSFPLGATFSCSFSPADPTLTSSSCIFDPASIPAGTNGAVAVTMSIVTAGPNPNSGVVKQKRRRADNRMPLLPMTLPLAGVVVVGIAGRKRIKYSVPMALFAALALAALLIACGSSSAPPISVANVVASPSSVYPNNAADGWPSQTSNLSVTITNDNQNKGVTWTAAKGSITSTGTNTATYTAPTIVAGLPASDTITATSVADSTKFATGSVGLTAATVPGTYTVTITVTSGTNQQALSPAPQIVVQ
jgi:subtilase family serine protease